ncbi:unnamed protein product [Cyclocybe aegerita]|uniref:Uncharacterized protein n=1 Tax=Cyclocybe aegerita TaxID=1973307 RepID=A0A8S0W6T5_CYCAE|nr:unnamed protein product [Cyclocybe aegerita]
MELLRLAPQLEECTFNMMETTEPGDPDPPTNNIAMPNLRALFFGANCEDRLDVFLVKLYLPVLEELHIDSITNLEPPIDLVSHFARWRCPLRRLLLSDHETQQMVMKRVLLQVPTLEYLHLSSSENNPAACDVLYALADRLGSADGTVSFLPRLKTFESFNTPPTFSWDVIPRIFSVSFDGVDPISPASLPPRPVLQRVIIHVNPEPDTNEVDQETMRRYLYLKRIGIELDIDPPLLSSHHSSV